MIYHPRSRHQILSTLSVWPLRSHTLWPIPIVVSLFYFCAPDTTKTHADLRKWVFLPRNFFTRTLISKMAVKMTLTPRVTRVPFRDVVILRAIFAHSRYLKMFDQKWLLSLNWISYQMVNSDFFCDFFGGCHNYEFKWRIVLFRIYHS